MGHGVSLESAEAFRSALRVQPEVAEETARTRGLGLYGWKTPEIEGFELPGSGELVVALHLGGSRRVRAVTEQGMSRICSSPGLVTVLPPGMPAAFRTEGSVSLVSLHVPVEMASALGADHLASRAQDSHLRFAFRDPFVSAGMETLLAAARSGQVVQPDYFARITDALICHLVQRSASAPAEIDLAPCADERMGRIALCDLLAYIGDRLGSRLTLDGLAAHTGLSRAAFTRRFRDAVGASPHQYVNARRVEWAKHLLRESGLDLAFIAQECGFSSQSHFTGVFRDTAGCTPARYRAGR